MMYYMLFSMTLIAIMKKRLKKCNVILNSVPEDDPDLQNLDVLLTAIGKMKRKMTLRKMVFQRLNYQ